jgi:hypothetical protein
MTVVSEVGWDMSKWKTENHFVSWLKLAPDNKIRGGKVIGKGRTPTNNRATTVLRMAATTLRTSDTYLGAQFRRLRTRLGPPVATKAMAAKLARLLYRMLRYGMKYVDKGAELYEAQNRKQQVIHLKRKAAQLGLEIIAVAHAALKLRRRVPGERNVPFRVVQKTIRGWRRHRHPGCAPERHLATDRLVSAARLGRVASRSLEARAKHSASRRRHAAACSPWDRR